MPLKTQIDEQPSLNLTSMIDVLFLLIIFFMVGTKFTEAERQIGLRLPQVTDHATLSPGPEKKTVQVYRDGQIAFEGRNLTLDELAARLTQIRVQYADLGIVVRSDAQGQVQRFADVLAACKRAGVVDLSIAVTPETAQRAKSASSALRR